MSHDAFISYSHSADSTLAPRLQDGLQRMAKPWWRRRALHVFRDTTGLSANPGLWSSIQTAMDDSEWFVFLASPEAAESPWVQREVGHWLETRGPDRLLPVVTDGTWVWDAQANDFDWAASTAVPAVLAGAFLEEPRHVDMTWARSEEQLDLRNGRFRDQVAEIAAPIHGVAKDDLEGADVRQHRATLRWAWGAAIGLLLLALVSGVAGAVAMQNADQAEQARAEAVENAEEAESQRQIAVEQTEIADTRSVEAQSERARAEDKTAEAEAEKRTADQQRGIAVEQTEIAKQQAEIAEDKTAEADAEAANARTARDAEARAAADARTQAAEAERQRNSATASAEIARLNEQRADRAATEATASQRETAKALVDTQQAKTAEEVQKAIALQRADEARVASLAAEQSEAVARDAEADALAARDEALAARDAEAAARRTAEIEALASASKAQAGQDGSLSLLLAVEAARPDEPAADVAGAALGRFVLAAAPTTSSTGRRALFEAVTSAQGGADAFRVDRYLTFPPEVQDPPVLLWRPVLSDDGRFLAAAELADTYRSLRGPVSPRVFVWDLSTPGSPVSVLTGHTDQVVRLTFAAGGRTLVSEDVAFDGGSSTVRMWDTSTGAQLLARQGQAFVAPDGDVVAVQEIDRTDPTRPFVQVRFVDARTAAPLAAPKPGRLSIDRLTSDRGADVQDPPYAELPFSVDGRYALGESNGIAVLWDLQNAARSVELLGPFSTTSSTPRVSPDGSVAVAFEDGSLLGLFDPSTGAQLASYQISATALERAVWSDDGARLATQDARGTVIVFDFDFDGDATDSSWVGSLPRGELDFTPDRRYLTATVPVPGAPGAYVTAVHDAATGALLGYFEGQVLAVSQGTRPSFFIQRADATLSVVAVGSSVDQRAVLTDPPAGASTSVAVSQDGRWFAAANTSGVRVWDLRDGSGPVRAAGALGGVQGLTFDLLGEGLTGVGVGGVPVMWDLQRIGAGSTIGTVTPDSSVLEDGVTVLEPIDGGTALHFRNLSTGATRPGPTLLPGERVDYVLVGPEGSPLVVNLADGGGAVVARSDASVVGRTTGTVLAVSRDGSRLVEERSGRTVAIRSAEDLAVVALIDLAALEDDDLGFDDSVALDPSGELLAATNGSGETVVWDVVSTEVVTTIPGRGTDERSFPLWGLGFSPDGERLVVKSPSNSVRMYRVSTDDEWEVLATQQLVAEFAGRVVFSPDGELVAIDGLYLLDGRSLAPIATLLAGPGAVTRFTSDGRSLVTVDSEPLRGDDDARGVVRWSVDADELIAEACRMAGRSLSPDEWQRYLGATASYRETCPR